MDIATILSSITASVGITAGGAWWLGKKIVDHRLAKELKRYETLLKIDADKEIINRKEEVREKTETIIARNAAELQYEYNAKLRLYEAIGPLRFQLLKACRDLALHIKSHPLNDRKWELTPYNYYGQTTLYKIILPITILELIERRISIADFSVDPEAVQLLCFKKAVSKTFSSNIIEMKHPRADWNHQKEHVFWQSLDINANALIVKSEVKNERPMMFDEFLTFLDLGLNHEKLHPFIKILQDFRIEEKPIFWTRLTCYAYLSADFVNKSDHSKSFEKININTKKMLNISNDKLIIENYEKIFKNFQSLTKIKL